MKRYETRLLLWLLLIFGAALLTVPLHAARTERAAFRTTSLRLEIGRQAALKYVLESDSGQAPQFSSDAPLVASVDPNGIVTAVSPGTAHITLRAGERLTATAQVTVPGVPTTSLRLDAAELTLQVGQRTRLTAVMNPGATDSRVFWSSDDAAVIAIDAEGLIEAVGGGSARVKATTPNGLTAEALVRVEIPAESVRVVPDSLTLGVGAQVELQAAFAPADATDHVAAWESTDESVLTVDAAGRLTAVGEGAARVRLVTASALAAYADVTVEAPAEAVAVVPAEVTVARGAQVLLEAVIAPEAALDHSVLWTTDAPEIAAVENGAVRGLAAGTARITAVVDGLQSAPCRVTVRIMPEVLTLSAETYVISRAEAGQPFRLTAEVLPADAEDKSLAFASDNEAVAAVDAGGIVSFTGEAGVAHITAQTVNGLKAVCTVTVTE